MEPWQIVALALVTLALVTAAAGAATDRSPRLLALLATGLLVVGGVTAALAATGDGPGHAGVTLVVAVTGLTAVVGGSLVTTQVFAAVDGRAPSPESVRRAGEVLRGGAWIGALERTAVYATLALGWPAGLAIVLGLKGLGRDPELRNQEHTGTAERFIIGTFTSVLWACGCAGIGWLLR